MCQSNKKGLTHLQEVSCAPWDGDDENRVDTSFFKQVKTIKKNCDSGAYVVTGSTLILKTCKPCPFGSKDGLVQSASIHVTWGYLPFPVWLMSLCFLICHCVFCYVVGFSDLTLCFLFCCCFLLICHCFFCYVVGFSDVNLCFLICVVFFDLLLCFLICRCVFWFAVVFFDLPLCFLLCCFVFWFAIVFSVPDRDCVSVHPASSIQQLAT